MRRVSKSKLPVHLALLGLLAWSCELVAQPQPGLTSHQPSFSDQTIQDIPILVHAPDILKGSLAVNQVNKYRIKLDLNWYVHITCEFAGVDGALSLYSPDGSKVQEVILPTSTEAMKELWWITRSAGDYRLEVQASDAKGSGKYRVYIRQLLANNKQNEKLIAAQQLLAEGWRLYETGTEDALREAIPKLQSAVLLWKDLNDLRYYFESSMIMGESYHKLSEYRRAVEVYTTLFPVVSDPNKVDTLWFFNDLASSHAALGETEKARQYYNRALEAVEENDAFLKRTRGHSVDARAFAIALTGLGKVSLNLGEKEKALLFFNKAIPYWKVAREGNRELFGLARTYRGLSYVYASLHDFDQTILLSKQALDYSRETADVLGQVETLNILGLTSSSYGNPLDAANYFVEGLRVSRLSGDRNGGAKALASLGLVYLDLGRFEEAEDSLNKALRLLRVVGNRSGEARALSGLGKLALAKNDARHALEVCSEALPLHRETRDREGEAATLYEMARAHLALNDMISARGEIEMALEQIEVVRSGFAGAEMRASYQSTVQIYYDFYIMLLMLMHQREPLSGLNELAFEKSEMARARGLLQSLREAGLSIREGVDPTLLARERELGQLLQDKSEARNRLFSRPSATAKRAEADKDIASLLNEFQLVEVQIRAASPHYAALTQPQSLRVSDIRDKVLDNDTALLEYQLGVERSFLWIVTKNNFVSLALPGRAKIESLAREFHQDLSTSPLPQSQTFRSQRERLPRAKQFSRVGMKLAKIILEPALPYIGNKRLLIVPDGALHYIPFAAFVTKRIHRQLASLISTQEIINLPSASTIALLRDQTAKRPVSPNLAAVFADPVFSSKDERVNVALNAPAKNLNLEQTRKLNDLALHRSLNDLGLPSNADIPRLISTRREAESISVSGGRSNTRLLLDFAANRSAVFESGLDRYQIIHFATHALVNSKHPELSGILLSLVDEQGQMQNGFLQAHELYNLKLSAELVVLSACDTALGKEIKGEGLISLTRGFMYAGARRVVSSLWKVDSKATAELMKRFYHELLENKLSPAAALRAAQLSISRDSRWNEPYYWAGFIIQGEYR